MNNKITLDVTFYIEVCYLQCYYYDNLLAEIVCGNYIFSLHIDVLSNALGFDETCQWFHI